MKIKITAFLLVLALSAVLLSSCSGGDAGTKSTTAPTKAPAAAASSTVDVDITEKMYVTYINEVYTNTSDYIGKTIRLEGMFTFEAIEETNMVYYYVYRTGPGCCGNDGSMCGFEFTYGGTMPVKNDWIEVIGTLRTYDENGKTYLSLDASSVKVLPTRGAEVVSN